LESAARAVAGDRVPLSSGRRGPQRNSARSWHYIRRSMT